MKIVVIIQARMGSSRLPGKVMLPLANSTVLGQVVSRVRTARLMDAVWIATSTDAVDDIIVREAERLGIECFRGSLDDVLARYQGAACAAEADIVVRVTSDCPLFDGALLDEMLRSFLDRTDRGEATDYLSNAQQRSYPRGLDTEIFTSGALARAAHEATLSHEREHVTPYLYCHPELFRLANHVSTPDRSAMRWTLDTREDWEFIRQIYRHLAPHGGTFSTKDVLALLKARPTLALVNAHIEQKQLPAPSP